ncbi:elongation of very long chain fatty acids protein 4 [Lingula anatina]|uniref:Elongation of very long chain fatty acids protein n=1 Tax=Lingula anatina TaxID=7574 RepID=A0A1S3JLJ9_LINAN|nr:elongation of very long chain fatty acids protein 4 [Lingula anatina]|eukprot:XP_013410784.1 elongation of very long chain fatty acids protein 4 [Lingula anatina]
MVGDLYSGIMSLSDPRTSEWFLMDSPIPSYTATALYLYLVWKGPVWMKSRPAYKLNKVLVVYNLGLVFLSVYMFWEIFASTVLNASFSLVCQPVDTKDDPMAIRLANVCWWYFFSKIIEFMDTFFFILRKKNNQITFLHVYHHSTMVLLWWIGVKFVPGGESYFSALVNSLIHILMYTYYGLSAIGPHMQKYLWWKKYMTSLQLLQFVIILFHTSFAMYKDCGFPNGYNAALILYMVSHIVLFGNFYHQTYNKRKEIAKPYENITKNSSLRTQKISHGE